MAVALIISLHPRNNSNSIRLAWSSKAKVFILELIKISEIQKLLTQYKSVNNLKKHFFYTLLEILLGVSEPTKFDLHPPEIKYLDPFFNYL